jgi:uncharacterized protein YjiK
LSFRYVQTFGVTEQPYIADTTHVNRPTGLFIDGSNNLYVTEAFGDRLLRYSSAASSTLTVGKAGVSYTDNYIFSTPDDVTLDASGNIWVADWSRVVQYSSAGTFLQQLPTADPWATGNDDTHFDGAHGVAFDNSGRLYVSDGNNHRVQVYDSTSGSPVYSTTIGVTGVSGNDNSHFNSPLRIAVDSSNRLYVADAGNNRVQRCTFSGNWSCSTFDSGLNNPQGIAVDGSNNVYIADTYNWRIRKCPSAGACSDFVTGTYGLWDVAIDSSGNIYGTATYESMVVKYNNTGTLMGPFIGVEFVPYLTDNYHYLQPRIAIDSSNNLIIVEEHGQRLTKLNSAGVALWSIGVPGVDASDNAHFNYPHGVATDKNGNIYVADGTRVQIFSGNGVYSATLGTGSGTGNYQFNWATGVAVDDNGNIYVVDYPNHRVQIYNSSLVYVGRIGETGVCNAANDHLCTPIAVAVDSAGNIYVTDAGNSRVQKFNSNRQWQMTIGSGAQGDRFDQFNWAEDVAVDAQGKIYVTDWSNNRVQVFDSSGAYLTTIGGAWGNLTSQFRGVSGVDVDSQGNVYVADFTNARIQKFAPGVPGWRQKNINGFGDRNNWAANRMSVWGNYLYVGTANNNTGGEVWRTANGATWSQVNLDGFGVVSNTSAMVGEAFNGYLYVGTGNSSAGAEVWRCATCNGTDWTRVISNGLGDGRNTTVERIVVFSNTLYATTDNNATGVEVWKSSSGTPGSWTQSNVDGFGDAKNTGLWGVAVFNDYLYVATGQWDAFFSGTQTGLEVWRTNNGITWNQVNTDGFGDPANLSAWIEPFNGYLYALSSNNGAGAQIWRCATCDGSDWAQVISSGFGDGNNVGGSFMLGFDNHFYICTANNVTGAEIWRTTNGTDWSQVNIDGFGDSNNVDIWSGAVFNNHLFLGTRNDASWQNPANGGEVWQMLKQVYLPLILRN